MMANNNLGFTSESIRVYGHGTALITPTQKRGAAETSTIHINLSNDEDDEHEHDHPRPRQHPYSPVSPQTSTEGATHALPGSSSEMMLPSSPTRRDDPPVASPIIRWLRQTPWAVEELRYKAMRKPVPLPPSINDFIDRHLQLHPNKDTAQRWPEEMLVVPSAPTPKIETPFYRMVVRSAEALRDQQLVDAGQLRGQRQSRHAPVQVKMDVEELPLCTLGITRRRYAELLVDQRLLRYQNARVVRDAMLLDDELAQMGEPVCSDATLYDSVDDGRGRCAQPPHFHALPPLCFEELAIHPRLLSKQRRIQKREMLHQRTSSEELYGVPANYVASAPPS